MNPVRISLFLVFAAVVGATAMGATFYFIQRNESIAEQAETGLGAVSDFALLDHKGRFHQLYRYRDAKAVVLYTHGVACPIVRNSVRTLRQLREKYAEKGVVFLLLNANPQDDRESLRKEAALLDVDMPILKDDTQLVTEGLDVARTGEAIVLDTEHWTIRYRGPIDDRLHYEVQKEKATRHYLDDAIDSVVRNRRVAKEKIASVGCLIDFEGSPAGAEATPSYAKDIAPILQTKCVACHQQGGIGPWSMDSYKTVQGWSAMMREVVINRRMPPWHADPTIGDFLPDRPLSIDEQRTLVNWIDAGAPRGDGQDPLAEVPPPVETGWPLGQPDLVMDVPEQVIPEQGLVPYRWIKLAVPISENKWVRAVDLRPSDRSVIHHGFVFVNYPENMKNKEPTWLEGLNGFFAAYVPGMNVLPFPEDSGQLLPAGSTLVFQLHYVTVGYPAVDRPKLALYFHDEPPVLEHKMASAANMAIRIPPHSADHEEQAVATIKEDGVLHGFYPHMHYRGSRFRYEAHYPDGTRETLLSVPKYDINWQTFYRFKKPKPIPAGTRMVVTAGFDNSDRNPANPDPSKEVRWGLKSRDEMLVGYFMYTRKREDDTG